MATLGWAKRMGGAGGDTGAAVAADASGVYTGGSFGPGQADFDPGAATVNFSTSVDTDGFVSKLTPTGTYAWAIQVGAFVGTIDNGDTGYAEVGRNWKSYTSGGFQGDARSAKAGSGTNTATWAFTGLPAGSYDVLATWKPNNQNATNARYTLNGVAAPLINQRIAPDDIQQSSNGSLWEKLGTVIVNGSQLTVVLTDQANGNVIADAIRVVAVYPGAQGPSASIARVTTSRFPATSRSERAVSPVVRGNLARWQPPIASVRLGENDLRIGQLPGDQAAALATSAGNGAGSVFAAGKDRRRLISSLT